jgi:hypothetical protein
MMGFSGHKWGLILVETENKLAGFKNIAYFCTTIEEYHTNSIRF